MVTTKEILEKLEQIGFEAYTIPDLGAKDGVCVQIRLNKEYSAGFYINESGNAVFKIDYGDRTVECTNAQQVIDIIFMTEYVLGTKFFYYKENENL